MKYGRPGSLILAFVLAAVGAFAPAQAKNSAKDWNFAVSGDSRNCGDVIMPAIAAGAHNHDAAFYWHLGDLRAIFVPDEDYLHQLEHRGLPPNVEQYLSSAWDDFIQSQIGSFGETPFYVGIGNHETIKPKDREQFVAKFSRWLDAPPLRKQRLADNHVQQVTAASRKPVASSSQSHSAYIADLLARVQRGEVEGAFSKMVADLEPELFSQAIALAHGNQAKAARWLGVTRLKMREKLNK